MSVVVLGDVVVVVVGEDVVDPRASFVDWLELLALSAPLTGALPFVLNDTTLVDGKETCVEKLQTLSQLQSSQDLNVRAKRYTPKAVLGDIACYLWSGGCSGRGDGRRL